MLVTAMAPSQFEFETLALKQCWQHSCVCVLKPASAPDAQHKDSTSLIEACSEWNPSWKTSVWPWPLYCDSVSSCYRTSYSLGHLWGDHQFVFFFAMRCHVEHPVVSMRELYSKNQIVTALKQDSSTLFNWTTRTHCTNTTTNTTIYLLPLDTMQRTFMTLRIRPMQLFFAYYCVYMCT